MTFCKKQGCIANLNGECVADKCDGALIQFPPCRIKDREARKKYYEAMRSLENQDFADEAARAKEQMRKDGVCEEDIELALSTIEDLRHCDSDKTLPRWDFQADELISKKAVLNIRPEFGEYGETEAENEAYKAGFSDALKVVAAFPAARGHWRRKSLDDFDEFSFVCSECNAETFMIEDDGLYECCPHCGVRMDRKVRNDE